MSRTIIIYLLFLPLSLVAQKKVTLSGYITDSESGEALIGTTIYDATHKIGTITNNFGFYSTTQKAGEYNFTIRYVGYKDSILSIDLKNDTVINIALETRLILNEVTVTARKEENATPSLSELSRQKIDIPMLNRMPVIVGEPDLLKSLQYLPGVKAGREGSAGFNVRGGSNDQNLILLDGVPVYNVSHVMGFFSVFNNDAIKNADLYKGGIPARFGGRLSSVLDVQMKEGNLYDKGGVFSISPISARISYESPIKTEKGAFIVSYRRSFIDLPTRLLETLRSEEGSGAYYFHDFNAKANWKFSDNSRLYLSSYTGRDKQSFSYKDSEHKSKGGYKWGNFATVLRWNKIFSNQLFANFSTYYSHFYNDIYSENKEEENNYSFITNSNLNDFSLKADFDYYPGSNYRIKFGTNFSRLQFAPNIQNYETNGENTTPEQGKPKISFQTDYYMENLATLGSFEFNFGGRFSSYKVESVNYHNFQPRISARWHLNRKLSASSSYMKTTQYIHLLTNSSMGMPTDVWVASTEKIKPQSGNQVSFGVSSNHVANYHIEVETYYKWMNNVIRFDEGTAFLNLNNSDWEKNVIAGKGRAYGIEMMAKKQTGRIRGMASYTLAWSERKFTEINSGSWFPFMYDRRHDLSLLAEFHFPEKYMRQKSISVGFTLQSGNNISIPDTEIKGVIPVGMEQENSYWETRKTFENPNNFKMPTFHHLDIAYNIKQKKTATKSISWNFSIYNVYNRLNPWFYYKDNGKVKQVSMFPIIPSVGFTYKW